MGSRTRRWLSAARGHPATTGWPSGNAGGTRCRLLLVLDAGLLDQGRRSAAALVRRRATPRLYARAEVRWSADSPQVEVRPDARYSAEHDPAAVERGRELDTRDWRTRASIRSMRRAISGSRAALAGRARAIGRTRKLGCDGEGLGRGRSSGRDFGGLIAVGGAFAAATAHSQLSYIYAAGGEPGRRGQSTQPERASPLPEHTAGSRQSNLRQPLTMMRPICPAPPSCSRMSQAAGR